MLIAISNSSCIYRRSYSDDNECCEPIMIALYCTSDPGLIFSWFTIQLRSFCFMRMYSPQGLMYLVAEERQPYPTLVWLPLCKRFCNVADKLHIYFWWHRRLKRVD